MWLSAATVSAQCDAPVSLLLTPPQTSTALVLKWPTAPGATQYQIRYWETANPDNKTIVDNCGPSPFTLRGLRKNTAYSMEIRSKCGNSLSAWGASLNASTLNSSGICNGPMGASAQVDSSSIRIQWASAGSHSIRYRLGSSGDWFVPSGALSTTTSPWLIPNLSPGTYQIEIRRNCSPTASNPVVLSAVVVGNCPTPAAPMVTPGTTDAVVDLPPVPGVSGYDVWYRPGTVGPWVNVGVNVPPSAYTLGVGLLPETEYQVHVRANCGNDLSEMSASTTFVTQVSGPCLADKNAGKYLTSAQILDIDQHLNRPSPFSFGSMIGVNDGGLVFRSFQNEDSNPITELTKQFRNFHTMDEDFDASLENYDLNIKPKDTQPEGTPANMGYNKGLYTKYREHGFLSITAATELLQYAPQSWKEKIYRESDWSAAGPAGILGSFENYTQKFIQEFAPANGQQALVSTFQVGNEWWDYPVKADYHNLLMGANQAFVKEYGPKSAGGWKMKLVAGAFQAYRDNNCPSLLRDFSNCNGALERHDFLGDYLQVPDCAVLKALDAIDCHSYSFKHGTLQWTHPEDPASEMWQIRSQAAWLRANQNPATGILRDTRLWSTEFGFDSYGVGERTQSAYLLRGLLLHSRFHFEKVFFYNAYDVAHENSPNYQYLYSSSGFWKQGQHPGHPWPSPLVAHNAQPKPAWFGMLDLKERFGEHVFHKSLLEDADAYVFLMAKPDSTEPYLVFWSPRMTNDANIDMDIPTMKSINWAGAFAEGYTAATTTAQAFAEGVGSGQTFESIGDAHCGSLIINTIRRSPAFIRLTSCTACPNITNPGNIAQPNPNMGSSPFDPGPIGSVSDASGGTGGVVQYQWQQSVNNSHFVDIPGAIGASYDPPGLTQTTYFRRAAKRSTCNDFVPTPSVVMVVGNACPAIVTFARQAHDVAGCNPAGDYYFDLTLDQVSMNDQITLQGLPSNGINITWCQLNDTPLTPATFQTNLHFVSTNSLQWQVNASLGSTQNLRLYYCWADDYPNPVATTTATSLCSGTLVPCAEGMQRGMDERRGGVSEPYPQDTRLRAMPNPGSDQMHLTYQGLPSAHATLRVFSATGQVLQTRQCPEVSVQQQWEIDTHDLPRGIYFVCLQMQSGLEWVRWEKM